MSDSHDPDIAAMNLSDGEKNGLQVYRNYTRAFENDRQKRFTESVKVDPSALVSLGAVLALIAKEEPRSLPVITCAFVDDQLKEMFRREIPEGVPGGRGELLSGFGPLARLSQRIQMAFAFGWLSRDVLIEIDHLRKVRNDVSHKWDVKLLESRLSDLIERRQQKIEMYVGDGVRLPEDLQNLLNPSQKMRLRLVWLLGRVTYECQLWVPALKANLVPSKALYGESPPPMLAQVSAACVGITRSSIISAEG